ncbi:unnamed protein product [Rotaria socialis]|uniref:Cap-specific mRNA (nucleoside-2'-O-)-methyltransferase 1 n=4 Tax=Rotaria socialis TaxID=392032 RepID=A0A817YT30_9BILA|nr:unnamed protein product [Rotaria socialis]CAF3407722.1 unnamed protein product [Rotaria socialis]CAF4089202.1 unnamed protein product [Rotaria socialis]
MSMSKKRKANEDDEQLPSKLYSKKNRSSADSNQSIVENTDSIISQTHYSPHTSIHKPLSSETSSMWSPFDSLNSSFSSTSTNSEYASVSSLYETDLPSTNNLITTTNELSMVYNPNHQMGNQETASVKRELSPSSNGTPAPKKKPRNDGLSTGPTSSSSSDYSSVTAKMMKNMGYDEKHGLGRNSKGPTKLVEESKQRGRRGLGFSYEKFSDETVGWDFENDPAPVEEEIYWCPSSDHLEASLNLDEMREWIKLGPKKKIIQDEIEFCDEDILREMLSGKTVFDELPQKEMEEARARSNVYETIGASIFLNRAAVKMANIDSVFGRIFTDPKTPNNQRSLVHPDEPFYFADICAGPGGFSEYILWKKQWHAKGFGFTLKGKSDFALHKFIAGTPETFDTYYGVKDVNGDGDIFKSDNIDALQNYVNKCTKHAGVHIVMADGGFSVEGQENIQEILSKQLYLCQFLTALSIIRPGGHFVCKLFDLFTSFSVGLVYLMYRTFDRISIHKPVTSRPANSERYIICQGLRGEIRDIVRAYMYEINVLQNNYGVDTKPDDVQSIVPMSILKGNQKFYEYIRNSNNQLGDTQIRNLKKIRAFVSNPSLKDDRQSDIRAKCLQFWEVPDEPRQKPKRLMYTDLQNDLFYQLGNGIENILCNMPNLFKNTILEQHRIQSLFDYRCILSLGDPILLLSCGRSSVYSMDLRNTNKRWAQLDGRCKVELPPYTLLLAERVQEQFNDGRDNRKKTAIYIIDAYFIGKETMLFQHGRPIVLMDRYHLLKLFEKAINKPAHVDLVPIRIHEQLRLEHMDAQFEKLCSSGSLNQIDNEQTLWFTNNDVETKPRIQVRGLWIFKFIQYPWTILLSKSHQTKYFHNQVNRTSIPAAPADSSNVASLRSMLENSFYWDFNNRDDPVKKSSFISFIQEKNHEIQSQRVTQHRSANGSN